MALDIIKQSVEQNLAKAYEKALDKGATEPENKNLENLEQTIESIVGGTVKGYSVRSVPNPDGATQTLKIITGVGAELQEKTVIPSTEAQEIEADDLFDGLSKVVVDAIPSEFIVPSGEFRVVENGNYDIKDYETVEVAVPSEKPILLDKTIQENGTYLAKADGADGYATVVVSVEGGVVTKTRFELPSQFTLGSRLYSFVVNNDKILCSTNTTNNGVWVYTISTGEWSQKYNKSTWSVFRQLPDGCCLICGGTGVLLYDVATDEVSVINASYSFTTARMLVNGDCILPGNSSSVNGVWIYRHSSRSIERKYNQYGWTNGLALSTGDCIMTNRLTSDAAYNGILLYNCETDTMSLVDSSIRGFSSFKELPNGHCLIGAGSYNSVEGYGIRVFKTVERTMGAGVTSGRSVSIFHVLTNGDCLISGTNMSGVYLYNGETFSQIYGSYNTYNKCTELPNGTCLLSSTDTNNKNILRYNPSDGTGVVKWNSGAGNWLTYHVLSNGDCLINGDTSNLKVLLYDSDADTISYALQAATGPWDVFEDLPDGNCIVRSTKTSNTYEFLWNVADKTMSLSYITI